MLNRRRHLGVRPGSRIPISSKKKIAFVCSGGGAKAGAFHLGVALALQEQGFHFQGGLAPRDKDLTEPDPMGVSVYVGSSAGSIIAAILASGYSLENIFNSFLGRPPSSELETRPRVLSRLTYQKMFRLRPELAREQLKQFFMVREILADIARGNWGALLQFKWLRTTGLFSTSGIEQYLRDEVLVSNRFQDYLPDLFVVGTKLNHSRKVVFGRRHYKPPPGDLTCEYNSEVSISDACAASAALPFVFSPYPIKDSAGREIFYIDGETRDTLSTHVAIDAGADLVIASHTHQPYHFKESQGSLTELGLPAILIQSLYLVIEQKIHNHVHNKELQRNAILAVDKYCRDNGLPEDHRKKISEVLQKELYHRLDVDTIYIHPNPRDTNMFLKEHFSLSPAKMTEIVRSGFKAAIDALRHYDFADRVDAPAAGRATTA